MYICICICICICLCICMLSVVTNSHDAADGLHQLLEAATLDAVTES